MNNEPVAWMKSNGEVSVTQGEAFCIPLYTHPAEPKELTVPENSQDWKGMDGATAFWLVERHSNHWNDARLMMEEWLKANTHPSKDLTDEEIDSIANDLTCTADKNWNVLFARAILRKAQEK